MEQLYFFSTRGDSARQTAGEAVLRGIAADGGLYVPQRIPSADKKLAELVGLSYGELAFEILKPYFTDFTEDELSDCIARAYTGVNFDVPDIAPLKEAGGYYFLELFHGRTLAFKDMALSILPHIMKTAAPKYGLDKKIIILTATSGDTGKAALAGFADVEGTEIVVFYPRDGVSAVQQLQMTTQEGQNTYVAGIRGNFDDAQTGVKNIFADAEINCELERKGCVFSSANSINVGRLLPQVVYYYYAYEQMVKSGRIAVGEAVNFTVPTGNFGNILAGYYAMTMGLPVHRLICASNSNNVLYDFFRSGVYDKNREFVTTASPSMDILVSSNLERLLYHMTGSAQATKARMEELRAVGRYDFPQRMDAFAAEYVSEEETARSIREMYEKGYIIDPHTAVAYAAYNKYTAGTHDEHKNVIISTASPFKFSDAVCAAISGNPRHGGDVFRDLKELSRIAGMEIPEQIAGLPGKEIRHKAVCGTGEMKEFVMSVIKG